MIKAVDEVNPLRGAQILSYLKLTDKRLGFLTPLPHFVSVGCIAILCA
jgi:hypothetical protein